MVELMVYTGMRPSEVCAMTLNQIDRSGDMWKYRPSKHKTAHHGKERVIPLGPNARVVLAAFLVGCALEPNELLFSPRRAREERFVRLRENRKTKVQPSQVSRKNPKPERMPADHYTPNVISHAVAIACNKAFPLPASLSSGTKDGRKESRAEWWKRLDKTQQDEVNAWRKSHRWHPYRLRHSFATKARKAQGLEAAGAALGHTRMSATEVYAERDQELAVSVAAKIG
jgi:integrase